MLFCKLLSFGEWVEIYVAYRAGNVYRTLAASPFLRAQLSGVKVTCLGVQPSPPSASRTFSSQTDARSPFKTDSPAPAPGPPALLSFSMELTRVGSRVLGRFPECAVSGSIQVVLSLRKSSLF